jgi:hypothetical protein
MPKPSNLELYEQVKKYINTKYLKPSAYRSAAYVKEYLARGGKYSGDKKKKSTEGLTRWFAEEWKDVNPDKTKTSYPVYRPTKRVTEKTPKTVDEISEKRLKEQAKLKQKIKGKKNLPKF